MTALLAFSCPGCGAALEHVASDELRCPSDGVVYHRRDGIWRFLLPEREQALAQFMSDYETVRRSEGRGDTDAAYYRSLPFQDLSGRFAAGWRVRTASFRALEPHLGRGGLALDLGSGCGWLAYRLAQRGYRVAAVDLQTNSEDGLGAYVHYDAEFVPVQAEFDRLPFATGHADLLVFNASLHYSPDYLVTIREALRVLRPGGLLAIVDSPLYRHASSGQAMVREREAAFSRRFGFPSNALSSENFLTPARLKELAGGLGVRWKLIYPRHGIRFAIRGWKRLLLGGRESARFPLIVARKES